MTSDTVPDEPARAGIFARIAAGLLAICTFLVAVLFSLGTVVAAPIGIVLVWWIRRRRGLHLSRMGAWVAASCASALLMIVLAAILFASMPEGALKVAIDEAESAEPQPMPEWLEALSPPRADNSVAGEITGSRAFNIYFGIMGGGIAILFYSGMVGSAGWAVTLLTGFALRAHWPLRPTEAELDPEPVHVHFGPA